MGYTVIFSSVCEAWLADQKRKDVVTYRRVLSRLQRMQVGAFGDSKALGSGVSELRLDFGPGYRVYYTLRGLELVVVLCCGDKKSQRADIERAKAMARAFSGTRPPASNPGEDKNG